LHTKGQDDVAEEERGGDESDPIVKVVPEPMDIVG
jgi:hypothetical protein